MAALVVAWATVPKILPHPRYLRSVFTLVCPLKLGRRPPGLGLGFGGPPGERTSSGENGFVGWFWCREQALVGVERDKEVGSHLGLSHGEEGVDRVGPPEQHSFPAAELHSELPRRFLGLARRKGYVSSLQLKNTPETRGCHPCKG